MRVECQHCGSTQPHDWAAGDLCVACGRAARSELRCFWCTEWTPEGRFCRTCGAELVPAGSYGAARMLKDAGTDRFTIPKMLRELDPAQIENFTRIYNAQLGAVRQHVDQVHFLERFSSLDVHAPALEEELVRRLPWPELPRPPPLDEGSDLERAQALAERSPFAATRALATVVRLRLDDWGTLREVQWMLSGGAGPLQAEAALALTSWRVLYAHGRPRERALRSQLLEILRGLPASSAVVVRLGALGEAVDAAALEGALHEPDRETALAAALVLGAVAPLSSALEGRDLLAREAAAERLVELGRLAEAEAYLRGAPPDAQAGLLKQALRLARPLTAWSELLLELVEGTADPTVRARAAQALCRAIPPGWGCAWPSARPGTAASTRRSCPRRRIFRKLR